MTWYRVLGQIDYADLETWLVRWAAQVVAGLSPEEELRGIAYDDKTLRGSAQQGAADAHLLSAVAHGLGTTLAQLAIAALRNAAITLLRAAGHTNIAQVIRFFAAQPERTVSLFGLPTGE